MTCSKFKNILSGSLRFIRLRKWWVLFLLVIGGCVDEIDLDGTGSGAGNMVVQGQLIKGCPSSISIRLSLSRDFVSRGLPPPVQGAVVLVKDNEGDQILVPETEPGLYQIEISDDSTAFSVEIGASYQLMVSTSEGGQYVSSTEILNASPPPDSVSIGLIVREELDHNNNATVSQYVQFFIHTSLETPSSQEKSFLRWTFQTIYQVTEVFIPGPGPGPLTCYISRGLGLDKVVVFNGNESNTGRLDNYMIVEDETEPRFGLGYLLTVNQHSLSREAYNYWNQVSQAVALSGGLFEATPGKITGNIKNINDPVEEVFGYFYVSEEQKLTRFVKPDDAGLPKHFCDQFQNATEDVCTNCRLIPFSSTVRPQGWEF